MPARRLEACATVSRHGERLQPGLTQCDMWVMHSPGSAPLPRSSPHTSLSPRKRAPPRSSPLARASPWELTTASLITSHKPLSLGVRAASLIASRKSIPLGVRAASLIASRKSLPLGARTSTSLITLHKSLPLCALRASVVHLPTLRVLRVSVVYLPPPKQDRTNRFGEDNNLQANAPSVVSGDTISVFCSPLSCVAFKDEQAI